MASVGHPSRVGGASSDEEIAFLRATLEASPALVLRLDDRDRVVFVSGRAGPEADGLVGRSLLELIPPSARDEAEATLVQVRGQRVVGRFRASRDQDDGTEETLEHVVAPCRETDGSWGVAVYTIDQTTVSRQLRTLRTSQERLQQTVETAQIGLFEWRPGGNRVTWNSIMAEIFGRSGPMTPEQYVEEVVHPGDRALILGGLSAIEEGPYGPLEYRILQPSGDVRWVRSSGRVIFEEGQLSAVVGTVQDTTPGRARYEHAREVQRLEAVDTLTSGIAHNFNNLLTVILPTLDELEPRLDAEGRELLGDARRAGQKAAELVRQLLDLAGRGETTACHHERVDLGEVLEEAVGLSRRMFPEVELILEAGPELELVGCPAALQQLFVKLVRNAREAVAGQTEGRIAVTAQRLVPARLRIDVSDNGRGMADAVATRVFEPFFTTRSGQGSGLGLTACLAIVKDHGGEISCRSAPGAGSTFTVELPVAGA